MLGTMRKHFLTGLLALAPLAITAWILWRFYALISGTMRPWLERLPALSDAYPEFFLNFVGFVVIVLLVMLVGLFTRNLIGVLDRYVDSGIITSLHNSAAPLRIGMNYSLDDTTSFFKGTADDICVYNRALTAAEIRFLSQR